MGRAKAWSLATLTVALAVSAVFLRLDDWIAGGAIAVWLTVTAVVAATLATRVARNAVGWLLLALVSGFAIHSFADAYARRLAAAGAGLRVDAEFAAWLALWLSVPSMAMLVFVLLVFPTGRVVSARWRVLSWMAAAALAVATVALALSPGPMAATGQPNPFGIRSAPWLADVVRMLLAVIEATAAAALVSLVLRYRRAAGEERQQLRWLATGGVVLLLGLLFAAVSPQATNELSFVAALIGLTAFPVTIGVAVLRYRLYDLGVVVNRAAVYLALTLAVIVLYVTTVVLVGTLFDRALGIAASLTATAIVALLFQPLRQRVQHVVDRLMYGGSRDPYAVLSGLGESLQSAVEPSAVPELMVRTLVGPVGLRFAAVEFDHGERTQRVAGDGEEGEDTLSVALDYQGVALGRLLYRLDSGANRRRTERLLADVARQASPALHALRLNADLQLSRERLVLAREEERRRLRAELHDSLGPQLAGLTLGLEAVENILDSDPAGASEVVGTLRQRSREAVGTVRAVIEGLRPPALDVGLVDAVRQQAASLAPQGRPRIQVIADVLPPLPAAVEVAAYRIAMEALTNVVRHAGAATAEVTLRHRGSWLAITVTDDGHGFPRIRQEGVGVVSMRERAEELGGRLAVESSSGGAVVAALLPIGGAS